MKSHSRLSSPSLVNGLFILTLAMLAYLGAIGFGTVWMRQKISVLANTSRGLEQQIAESRRELHEVEAELAAEGNIQELSRKNAGFGLNMMQPRESQVVRVAEDVERRLAGKRFDRLFSLAESAPDAPESR